MESIAKIIKEIKRRNKKSKENQTFNFIWVISHLFIKIESVYFNYWSETLVIIKKGAQTLLTFRMRPTTLIHLQRYYNLLKCAKVLGKISTYACNFL